MDLRERAGSIVCGVDGIVLLLQRIGDRLADIRFVFNYQDSHLPILPRYYVCVQRLMALSDPDNTGILRFVLRQIIASVEVPFPDDRFLPRTQYHSCLLYTSDAADDLLCVDLGGRRIIKKK